MVQINDSSHATYRLAEEVSAASESLDQSAAHLHEASSQFRLGTCSLPGVLWALPYLSLSQ